MKKYVLAVEETDEPETLWYEVNIDVLLSSLDISMIHHVHQALDDGKEIRLIKTNSKTLVSAIMRGDEYEINR